MTGLAGYLLENSRYLEDNRYESLTCLYRYFGAEGELLYIGISNEPEKRDHAHWSSDEFHTYSLTMTVEIFPTRALAELAECIAIYDEDPEFNTKRKTPARDMLDYPRYKWYIDQQGGRLIGEANATLDIKSSPEFWRAPVFQRQSGNER